MQNIQHGKLQFLVSGKHYYFSPDFEMMLAAQHKKICDSNFIKQTKQNNTTTTYTKQNHIINTKTKYHKDILGCNL